MEIKIIVAAHKLSWFSPDGCYLPLHVGKKGKAPFGITGDDTGTTISEKNPNYCELTGVYWFWKNCRTDYVGLCHYRRYFSAKNLTVGIDNKRKAVFSRQDYERLLVNCDCILPKKRNYFIETVRSQYNHAHQKKHLDEVEQIIKEICPQYSQSFTKVMNRRRLHIYNMFVMKWDLFDRYCTFLFDVLFELEKRIDITDYDTREKRVFGFIGERLLDVWIDANHVEYVEAPIVFLGNINWLSKGMKFLMRKFAINN
jgi:hypothetical protein